MSTETAPDDPNPRVPGVSPSPKPSTGQADANQADFSQRLGRSGIVEDFYALVAQSGSTMDPVLNKMGPKHIDHLLKISEERQNQLFALRREEEKAAERFATKVLLLIGFVFVLTFSLCWLFLFYGKTDQVFNLITLLFTGAGGVGIGIGSRKIAPTLKRIPTDHQESDS